MSILQMSFSGAILILAIVVIRTITINKLPKKTFLVLWGIVLLRLLIPFSIPSIFSVYSLVSQNKSGSVFSETETAEIIPKTFIPNVPKEQINYVYKTKQLPVNNMPSVSIWFIIWCIGMAFCATFFIISYLRCFTEFQTSLPIHNDYVKQWLKEHPLKRPLSIKQSDRIFTPLTYGIFHPVILMPKSTDWNNTMQLQYVLSHEYIHIQRYDTITKLITTAALCIHWFNPMVWIMYILFNRDIELACDESVIRQFGEISKSDYALMLISMEAKKSSLLPFCSSFSKNAIEERITAIMKIKKTSFFTILFAVIVIVGAAAAFATSEADTKQKTTSVPNINNKSATDNKEKITSIPNTNFSDKEYKKLLSLQFDDYKDMTVSQYQNKVWKWIDKETKNRDLLERFTQDETLYEMRESNEIASFLFNELVPLTAQDWKKRRFSGHARTNYPKVPDNATAEIFFTLMIQKPDMLTVKEYSDARFAMVNWLPDMLKNKTKKQLHNEAFMNEIIETKIDNLIKQWSTDKLQIKAKYFFSPLSPLENDNDYKEQNTLKQESRETKNGTQKDYSSLLALKTADYQQMSVADFNFAFLDWGNRNFNSSERISRDIVHDDIQVDLTKDELSFVKWTISLSRTENYQLMLSLKNGTPEKDPDYRWFGTKKTKDGYAWCNFDYRFSYHISDKETVTVGERNNCIGSVINDIQKFWEKTSLNNLLKMTKNDVAAKLQNIAAQYSNDNITITINKKELYFEHADERDIK